MPSISAAHGCAGRSSPASVFEGRQSEDLWAVADAGILITNGCDENGEYDPH
jgi:hypothetical protein